MNDSVKDQITQQRLEQIEPITGMSKAGQMEMLERDVKPLVLQITERCRKYNIPHRLLFAVGFEDEKTNPAIIETSFVPPIPKMYQMAKQPEAVEGGLLLILI